MSTLVLDPALTRTLRDLGIDPQEYITIYNATFALYKAQLQLSGVSNKDIAR